MKRRILALAALALFSQSYAQTALRDVIRGDNGVTKHFVTLTAAQQVAFNPNQATSILNLQSGSNLVLLKSEKDEIGQTNYRYYQSYNGIPVEGSMYIVQTKGNKATALSGEIITDFPGDLQQKSSASISAQQAVDAAVKNVNAQLYAWQDAAMEQRIKEQTGNTKSTYAPTAKLVWVSTNQDALDPKSLTLCYKVDVYARVPLSRADYFVDAKTGQVIGKNDRLYFTDAVGTAATAWSGTQTIHSDFTGSTYRLRDYTKGSGIITLHGESGKRGNEYTSSSANWSLAGFDQAALDAHYGVSQTYTFYMTAFARNSYDNNGTALYSYVNDPTYIDNAFWDGSAMNYNKRSTNEPGGVTGIDVTGHELTHGVTQSESNLTYSRESGAMNESISDIMGKTVQFFSKPTDINWQLSNDMNWLIRDLSNPKLFSQPNTYKGQYWVTSIFYDNGGVHINSGIGNYFFYLLVHGGTGTNDNGDSYTVSGIGVKKAASIVYRTNTVYLVPGSKFADWRTACISAAIDLYGAGSKAVIQVQNAWHAVGVGDAATLLATANAQEDAVASTQQSAPLFVSPNPITGGSTAMVSYSLLKEGNSTLKVIDLNGTVREQVSLGKQSAGSHTYTLGNVSKLPTGNYVILIEQNGIVVTRNRFVVSK